MTFSKTACYTWCLVYCIIALSGCKSSPDKEVISARDRKNISITAVSTDKGAYRVNELVKMTFSFNNEKTYPLTIKNIKVLVRNISMVSAPLVYERKIDTIIDLNPEQNYVRDYFDLWKIPADAATNAYGLYLQYELNETTEETGYQNFFRIIKETDLITYRIDHSTHRGLDIYALHGGMSAECTVEKAAENLKPGIAHTWFINAPGSGPEHVLATPQFLQNSVKETVDFYNRSLGRNTVFETVIIGPGLETLPYMSHALKAPVLPLHFLVSSNTAKEIQSVLDYSNKHGYVSYATLGHDYSVPFAVSWVKLLEMPEEYVRFLQQHKVKNIVFAGYAGSEGENTAKKVVNNAAMPRYSAGSLFILYPGGGSKADLNELQEKIVDFNNTPQQKDFIHIADWESGIIDEQITRFAKKAKEQAGIVNTRYITTADMIHLWDFATYISAAFIHKNKKVFTKDGGLPVKGISLNPYFVTNAFYETYNRFIPLIYWQNNPEAATISRLLSVTRSVLTAYFPEVKITDLACWINSSNNFGGITKAGKMRDIIRTKGFNSIIENDYTKDDVWDPSDGMTAPVEIRVTQLADVKISAGDLIKWNNSLQQLSLEDLDEIGKKFPEILVKKVLE